MEYIFLKVLNMSISAVWMVLAVLVVRLLFKKVPRSFTVFLWALVGVRLACPFALESIFSLIPSAETVPAQILYDRAPAIQSGISSINAVVNPILSESMAPAPLTSVNPMQLVILLGWNVWILGMLVMALYIAVSYLRLRFQVRVALCLQDNVYICDQVHNPFILGIFRPRIYLPSALDEQQRKFVLAHEHAHLQRRDHWWKPLGFLLLTVHWFNPVLWIAYCLLCRDIEFACDEKVIANMDAQQKKGYSEALVACSLQHRLVMACPLAFGEVGVKARIQSVLHYKKPAFWIVLVALILCAAVAVGFLTDPVSQPLLSQRFSVFLDVEISNHHLSEKSIGHYCAADYEILGSKTHGDETTVYLWVMYQEYSYDQYLRKENGCHIPTVITAKKVNDYYELVEYWEPRDGSYYARDIQDKFPSYLHSQALDSQSYADKQQDRLTAKAQAYYDQVNTSTVYEYTQSPDLLNPTLRLSAKNHSFYFSYSGFSSYIAIGGYREENGQLILSTSDNLYTYVFDKRGDCYVFDATHSSPIPEYRYAEGVLSPVPHGAVFQPVAEDPGRPPFLSVSCDKQSITAWVGTYEWETTNLDGTKKHVNADSSHPLTCLDSVSALPLIPTTVSALEPHKAVLRFSQEPKQISIRRYLINDLALALGTGNFEEITCTDNSLSLAYGLYLYDITATFDSPSGKGTVHYAFYTSRPTIEQIPNP